VANDLLGTFLVTFSVHEILQLRKIMQQFVHKQNLLGQVTAKNQKDLVKVIHVLAESQPQLIQLALDDQLSIFEDRIDTVISAI
jgi:hypothetical protein